MTPTIGQWGTRVAGTLAVAGCLALAGTGAAIAQEGGAGYGGAKFVAKPAVKKVKCLRGCASRRRARPGATLKITGAGLGSVRRVVFLGSYGRGDDVAAKVRAGSSTRIQAKVPMGAVSGPIRADASRKVRSKKSKAVPILPAPPPEPNGKLSAVPGPSQPGAPKLETGTSRTRVYHAGRRVRFSYRLTANAPVDVKIELVRAGDGAAVASWTRDDTPVGVVESVTFNGTLPEGRASQGRYSFRLTAAGPSGATARSTQAGNVSRDAFDLYDHVFPVRGKHNYGGSGADFGSGRGGRSHKGHDVFARCGVKMLAARGGKVRYSGYHSAAGNYVVIRGTGTRQDYAYMHLAELSPFRRGDQVYTGQRIGAVGESGNARGCHLHFELWSAPGWYDGGSPFDPLPQLKAWDRYS